jgi:hypothetical protein
MRIKKAKNCLSIESLCRTSEGLHLYDFIQEIFDLKFD